jgi:hypothetical protein
MREVTFAEVLTEAREVAADPETSWPVRSWSVGQMLSKRLGLWDEHRAARTSGEYAAVEKFQGQALRAFNKLAGTGVLQKAGARSVGPDGHWTGNEATFWTQLAWDTADKARQQREAAAAALREQWAAIYDQLAARGFEPVAVNGTTRSQARGLPVTLSPGSWERLLDELVPVSLLPREGS